MNNFDVKKFLDDHSEITNNGHLQTKDGNAFVEFYKTLMNLSREELVENCKDPFDGSLPDGIEKETKLDLLIGSLEMYSHLIDDEISSLHFIKAKGGNI